MNELIKIWEEHFKLAQIYYNHYGNALAKHNFKTSDGVNYNPSGFKLGTWIYHQFNNYSYSTEKIKKLESIGIDHNINYHDYKWNTIYNLVYNYYKHYKNLNIDSNFRTLDGINYHKDGYKLNSWIKTQLKSNLNKEQIKKLNKLNLNIGKNKFDIIWDKYYLLAVNYYNHYGNLKVPVTFKTLDGINYNESGIKLGSWLSMQRTNKYLEENRIIRLNNIGMIWSIRKNKTSIINICKKYNININKNKSILKKSYNEVYAKICYLIDLNIPIIDENGIINNIMYISNKNLELNYNINMEYLINKYSKNKSKIK